MALPAGYEAQVRPRSGLAFKKGITVLNSPGTIDADYRGDIGVILINHGQEAFEITDGERIAQMVVAKHETVVWSSSKFLTNTKRGEGGFGPFKARDALFEHCNGGVAVAGVDIFIGAGFDETRLGGLGAVIDKALGQENRLAHLAILAALGAAMHGAGAGFPVRIVDARHARFLSHRCEVQDLG